MRGFAHSSVFSGALVSFLFHLCQIRRFASRRPANVQDVAFLLGIHWRDMTDVIGPLRLSGD
jgi:hypothetical protein